MTKYSTTIPNKHSTETYAGIKETFDWLHKQIRQIWPEGELCVDISFCIGALHCTVNSIDDFVEQAYGASECSLNTLSILVYNRKKLIASIFVTHRDTYVNAINKQVLEYVVTHLTQDDELQQKQPDITPQVFIQQNNGIIAASADQTINIIPEEKESTIHKWWTAILQNLVSNWIGYLITALLTAIATYFMKQ